MDWVSIGAVSAGVVAGLARKNVRSIRVEFAGALVAPWPANENGAGQISGRSRTDLPLSAAPGFVGRERNGF